MGLQRWMSGLVVLAAALPAAEATNLYDPKLCYILDGFLCLYGLIITGMFIKEKFFRTKVKLGEESIYSDLVGQDAGGYAPLMIDPEGGRTNRRADDSTYTGLNTSRDRGEVYKQLPVKKEHRQRKSEQVYQGLTSANRDTYDALQMQPLPAR